LCWGQEKVHSQPSIDILAEDPASSNNYRVPRKKVNPARARRSKLRFEEFLKKKVTGAPVQVSKVEAAAGVIRQLVTELPLDEKIDLEPGLNSPVTQLGG
jgi:hypothetical protein